MLILTGICIGLALALLFLRKKPQSVAVVSLPVTACTECHASFDLQELDELPLLSNDKNTELRLCNCETVIEFNRAGFEQDFMTCEEYAEIWPDSPRLQTRVFCYSEKKGLHSV